jgi:hypothetical protein
MSAEESSKKQRKARHAVSVETKVAVLKAMAKAEAEGGPIKYQDAEYVSQQDLAKFLQVDSSTISAWKAPDTMNKIHEAYGQLASISKSRPIEVKRIQV